MTGAPDEAVRYARRLTLGRGLRGYVDWVGRAVGWGTVAWILFWLVVYAIASAQILPRLKPPISAVKLPVIFSSLGAAILFFVTVRSRTPPAFLGRRDLYRLGLPALAGTQVMAWPINQARGLRFLIGAVLGAVWTLVSSAWFGISTPWAAPTLALVMMASLDLEWLSYAARDRENRGANLWLNIALGVVIVSSLTGWLLHVGLPSGMWNSSPIGLIAPITLGAVGWIGTGASLRFGYPTRFATHAQILGELRAMQFMMILTRSMPDPDQQRRLRDQLRDSPTAIKPNRFLPVPAPGSGARGALAWRTALTIYRRPLLEQLDLVVRLGVVALSSISLVRGPGGLLLEVIALVFLLPRIIGPEAPNPMMPINGGERTLGRTLPGIAVILVGSLIAAVIAASLAPFDPNLIVTAVTRTILALVVLEKFAVWRGTSPRSIEASISAALLSVAPTVLLDMFGLGSLAPTVQVALIGLLLLPTP